MNPEFTSYRTILGNPKRKSCYPIVIGARDEKGRISICFGSSIGIDVGAYRPAPLGAAAALKALAMKQFSTPNHVQSLYGRVRSGAFASRPGRGQGAGKKRKTRRARQGITEPSTPAVVPMVNRISPEADKARKKLLAQKLKARRR